MILRFFLCLSLVGPIGCFGSVQQGSDNAQTSNVQPNIQTDLPSGKAQPSATGLRPWHGLAIGAAATVFLIAAKDLIAVFAFGKSSLFASIWRHLRPSTPVLNDQNHNQQPPVVNNIQLQQNNNIDNQQLPLNNHLPAQNNNVPNPINNAIQLPPNDNQAPLQQNNPINNPPPQVDNVQNPAVHNNQVPVVSTDPLPQQNNQSTNQSPDVNNNPPPEQTPQPSNGGGQWRGGNWNPLNYNFGGWNPYAPPQSNANSNQQPQTQPSQSGNQNQGWFNWWGN